ncbi:alkaline phosphatase family protein [Natronoglomus mannanivorans]|uniref:Alkaline phosphatase family protein n=1 Tax=Natronoglomus mannanivorans TaxID=2979990 RepID=A0AAP2YZY3_9EURY|nr:alkaline phosphatase family protein [Halobacteria archaeon AArc-xg1-1]
MQAVVLGFDGLDAGFVDRFESSLPNITRLRERGVEAPLESTYPPGSASAWPSLYTGTDPSHHGVFGAFRTDSYPDEATPASGVDVRRPAIWDYLSSEGASSVVLNVPLTHPADPINGVVVPGLPAGDVERGYPDGICEELNDEVGEPGDEYTISEAPPEDDDDRLEYTLDLLDQRRQAAVALLEREEWELAVCGVRGTDIVSQGLCRDQGQDDEIERIRTVYEAADRLVGDVLETVDDETTVVLCSSHGTTRKTGYRIDVNEILAEHGYLETTSGSLPPATLSKASEQLREFDVGEADESARRLEEPGVDGSTETGTGTETDVTADGIGDERSLVEMRQRDGDEQRERGRTRNEDRAEGRNERPISNAIGTVADRTGLRSALERLSSLFPVGRSERTVDWHRSRAYCAAGSHMGIRVNLAGREPYGRVTPSEYETVCTAVVDLLSSLETPDGEPAFEFVCRREHLYDGPFVEKAPDVFVLPKAENHIVSASISGRGEVFHPIETDGHALEGVFVGAGPGFDGETPNRLSITDVAPITMAALGRPVPSVMTGIVPEGLTRDPPVRADYPGIAIGSAIDDPTFDDEKLPGRLTGSGLRDW